MHYEEQVIDGILYFRSTPSGKWYQFGISKMTERLVTAEARCADLQAENTRLLAENERLNESLALARVLVAKANTEQQ
jgi:hypothetical protein